MIDISHLNPNVVGCFLAGSLAGKNKNKPSKFKRSSALLARLIDKAIYEYSCARDTLIKEQEEENLSYEEIIKRDDGQYFFTCEIMNHLENCINAVSRIYKTIKFLGISGCNKSIINIRNSIEHMDERIDNEIEGPVSLNVLQNKMIIEIASGSKLNPKCFVKLDDLANEISSLYKVIKENV